MLPHLLTQRGGWVVDLNCWKGEFFGFFHVSVDSLLEVLLHACDD